MGLYIGQLSQIFRMMNTSVVCCCKKYTERYRSSYFIHELAVKMLVLLLLCADFSLGFQQTSPRTALPGSSTLLTKDGLSNSYVVKAGANGELSSENTRTIKDGDLASSSKTLFFGEDTNGVPIVTGTWFRYGSYTLAFCMFGTAFLAACAASSVYYVLFVVTEPSQQRYNVPDFLTRRVYRSANVESNWTVGRVLRALQLAYETYESFDPYIPACQLKTVCEIQESDHFQGSMLKRLTHFMIHTEMVRKKLANADGLQAADRIGNDPEERCSDKYPECRGSLNRFYADYLTI